MSPVTGRIILPMMPDIYQDYIWVGDRNDRPMPSPIIIDLRLEIIDLRRRLSETRFILQAASNNFDSSQALNELIPGILKHNEGIVSIALPWVDYVPVDLPLMNIWIGDENNVPQPYPRIFLQNLPSMANTDPLKLFGAYNLYSGSSNPLTIGEPEIVKTLHITNMADLPQGNLWLGTNSSDPTNFGFNRPVPIVVLPLDNMADLPFNKIWRGNLLNRPEPSDDLTNLEENVSEINDEINNINDEITNINNDITNIGDQISSILDTITSITNAINSINDLITNLTNLLNALQETVTNIQGDITTINEQISTINSQISTINSQITDINNQISTINSQITDINTHLGDIDTHLGDIDTHLGDIDTHLGDIDTHLGDIDTHLGDIDTHLGSLDGSIADLQNQIDSNVSSGLDHLADLQGQIDAGINSGLDHLADLQGQIDSAIASGNDHLATLNGQIDNINTEITNINTTTTDLQNQINNLTTVVIPAVYTYVDESINTAITNLTNNFIAGGVVDMNNNPIKNLPCDPVEDNDAVSFCFLWHLLHEEVTVSWQ
jgi:predicted  nucleic acid-binding Zn-ribbon protein